MTLRLPALSDLLCDFIDSDFTHREFPVALQLYPTSDTKWWTSAKLRRTHGKLYLEKVINRAHAINPTSGQKYGDRYENDPGQVVDLRCLRLSALKTRLGYKILPFGAGLTFDIVRFRKVDGDAYWSLLNDDAYEVVTRFRWYSDNSDTIEALCANLSRYIEKKMTERSDRETGAPDPQLVKSLSDIQLDFPCSDHRLLYFLTGKSRDAVCDIFTRIFGDTPPQKMFTVATTKCAMKQYKLDLSMRDGYALVRYKDACDDNWPEVPGCTKEQLSKLRQQIIWVNNSTSVGCDFEGNILQQKDNGTVEMRQWNHVYYNSDIVDDVLLKVGKAVVIERKHKQEEKENGTEDDTDQVPGID